MIRSLIVLLILNLHRNKVVSKILPDFGIVDGDKCEISDFPYMVSFEYDGRHKCGGLILNENTILTAAHCTAKRSAKDMFIRAGSTRRAKNGIRIPIKKYKNHPNFNRETYDNDISLIFLNQSLEFNTKIQSINLPNRNEQIPIGQLGNLTGWGQLNIFYASSPILRKVQIPILESEKCQSIYEIRINKNMLCAGYLEGGRGPCLGDSGGPLVINNTIYGIVSFGDGCESKPSIFTNIINFRTWIDEILKME